MQHSIVVSNALAGTEEVINLDVIARVRRQKSPVQRGYIYFVIYLVGTSEVITEEDYVRIKAAMLDYDMARRVENLQTVELPSSRLLPWRKGV